MDWKQVLSSGQLRRCFFKKQFLIPTGNSMDLNESPGENAFNSFQVKDKEIRPLKKK